MGQTEADERGAWRAHKIWRGPETRPWCLSEEEERVRTSANLFRAGSRGERPTTTSALQRQSLQHVHGGLGWGRAAHASQRHVPSTPVAASG